MGTKFWETTIFQEALTGSKPFSHHSNIALTKLCEGACRGVIPRKLNLQHALTQFFFFPDTYSTFS